MSETAGVMQSLNPPGHEFMCCMVHQFSEKFRSPAKPSVTVSEAACTVTVPMVPVKTADIKMMNMIRQFFFIINNYSIAVRSMVQDDVFFITARLT